MQSLLAILDAAPEDATLRLVLSAPALMWAGVAVQPLAEFSAEMHSSRLSYDRYSPGHVNQFPMRALTHACTPHSPARPEALVESHPPYHRARLRQKLRFHR